MKTQVVKGLVDVYVSYAKVTVQEYAEHFH